jgi:mannitol-1-phosphate 5-dehydrogenase
MKKAVIFGAGNIGRGFLGQLFCESGYEVLFIEINRPIIAALNERHSYILRLVESQDAEEVVVGPVRALDGREVEPCAQALAEASLAATAVGAAALPVIAPALALGISRRHAAAVKEPLNIIVCENLKNAARALRNYLREHLAAPECAYLDRRIGLVDSVIARMVPIMPPELAGEDPSLVLAEPYKRLPVDKSAFVGRVPAIVGLEPYGNFAAYVDRKLYLHNAGHAMLAYLGYKRGLTYGYEALEDPQVRPLFERALREAAQALVAEHGFTPADLEEHIADLTRRFANRALGDTIFRLGRDPIRKLAPDDRLVGAARLAEKHDIIPAGLAWGIAAGLSFADPRDPLALDVPRRLREKGISEVLVEVCAIRPDEPLGVIVADCYRRIQAGALVG